MEEVELRTKDMYLLFGACLKTGDGYGGCICAFNGAERVQTSIVQRNDFIFDQRVVSTIRLRKEVSPEDNC
jgi:hypothetical protein